MTKKLTAALLVLMLVTLACSFTPQASSVPATPTGSSPQTSNVLFHDDFSDTGSGWDRSTTENGTADYANGGYEIHITAPSVYKWANPSKGFQSDVRIEVDATKVGGPDDNAFGVMCRYQDSNNFYKLYITSDGYAGVIKEANGNPTVISSADGKLQPVKGINQGALTNHIRADCLGDTLTLYANGTQVATATDSSFQGGDVDWWLPPTTRAERISSSRTSTCIRLKRHLPN